MIPARIGSERLKFKNLSMLEGKPLIYYAIKASQNADIFDQIYINSDNQIFEKISKRYGCKFYLRKKSLGGSNIKSDQVVYDFFKNNDCEILMWVNPIAPLIKTDEIKETLNYFLSNQCNSLITVHKKYAHSLLENIPINFKFNEVFSKTQDLKPIVIMNYSLMMWTKKSFMKSYERKGHAILHGKRGFYEISNNSALNVKYSEDLLLISKIMKSNKKKFDNKKIAYDRIINVN